MVAGLLWLAEQKQPAPSYRSPASSGEIRRRRNPAEKDEEVQKCAPKRPRVAHIGRSSPRWIHGRRSTMRRNLAWPHGLESEPVFGRGFLDSGLDTPMLMSRKLNPLRSSSSSFMQGSLRPFYRPPRMPRAVWDSLLCGRFAHHWNFRRGFPAQNRHRCRGQGLIGVSQ